MACGYFAFIKITTWSFDNVAIIIFVITAFDWIFMEIRIIDRIIGTKEKVSNDNIYDEVFLGFPIDYDRQNPVS